MWGNTLSNTNALLMCETVKKKKKRPGIILSQRNVKCVVVQDLRRGQQWWGVGGDVVQVSSHVKPVDHVVGISLPRHPSNRATVKSHQACAQ